MAGDLDTGLLEAFGREQTRLRGAGLPPTTYGQFVDGFARHLESKGDGRARAVRDSLVQHQAAGEGFGTIADVAADAAPTPEAAGRIRGVRAAEQAAALPSSAREANRAVDTAGKAMGGGLAETVALGSLAMADATPGLKQVTERIAGKKNLEGFKENAREDTGVAGKVAEIVGENLPFLTAAGVVSRTGALLQATTRVRPILSLLGKALASPIGSFAVTGAGLRTARAGASAAVGDTKDAMETLRSIPAGAAQDTLLAIASIPMRAIGRFVEKGVMRGLVPQPRLAQAWGKTIGEQSLKDIPAAAAAKFLGGAAEFAPFSYVPNLVDPHDPTNLSPEAQVLFSPGEWGSDRWKAAGAKLLLDTAQKASEAGIAGTLAGGVMGLGHAVNRPESGRAQTELRRLTTDDWRGVHAELLGLMDQAAQKPEIAHTLITFLSESQRLKESVAKQRGDIKADVSDFGDRVRDFIERSGLKDGTLTPPKGEAPPAGETVPPAGETIPPAGETPPGPTGDGAGPPAPVPVSEPAPAVGSSEGGTTPGATEPTGPAPKPPTGATGGEPPPVPPAPKPKLGAGPGPRGTDRRREVVPVAIDRRKAEQERRTAERAAHTDPLTGIGNKRAAEKQIARKAEGDRVVIHDIEKFKRHNDAKGHAGGDEMLKAAAAHYQRLAVEAGGRASDVTRIGGDEFQFVGPEAVAKKYAELVGKLKLGKTGNIEHGHHVGIGNDYAGASKGMAGAKESKAAPRNLETAAEGHPVELEGHRGEGATREEVYGKENVAEGRAHPILGPGRYVATNPKDATRYAGKAGKVSPEKLRLERPFVVDSDKKWREVLRAANAEVLDSRGEHYYTKAAETEAATKRVQEWLRARGHDGAVVRLPEGDANPAGASVKMLREVFGHSQAVRFADKAAAAPAARPAAPHAAGRETEIPVPGGTTQKAKYAVMEGEHVLPSHDPTKDFAPSPGYPTENRLQERRYDTDVLEQQKVQDIAKGYDPYRTASTAPEATHGSSIVDPSGVVINGNGREMARRLLTPEQRDLYRKFVTDHAASFGIDPKAVEGMKDPVLVRVVDMNATSKEAAEFGRRGNQSTTQALGPIDRAARAADLIPDDVLASLSSAPDLTFSEAVVDATRGKAFRKALEDAIPRTERAEFFKEDGTLTEQGKELARNILLTKSIGVENARSMPPGLRRTLSDSAVQLAQMRRDPAMTGVYPAFNEAIDHFRASLRSGEVSPAEVFDGGSLLLPPPISDASRIFLDFLYENRDAPKRMRDGLTRLLERGQGEGGMFGTASPADITRRGLAPAEKTRAEGAKEGEKTVFYPAEVLGVDHTEGPRAADLSPTERGEMTASDATLDMAGAPHSLLPTMPADPTPAFRGRRVGRHRIMDALQRVTDVPIRVARMGTSKALGFFKVKARVVRLKEADDTMVAAHEIGHSTERYVWPMMKADPRFRSAKGKPGIHQELVDLGVALYGSNRPWNGYGSEGWAEFIRHFVENPAHLAKEAPQALDWFEKVFGPKNKPMLKRLLEARDLTEQYRAQGTDNRLEADMRPKEAEGFARSLAAAFGRREWIEEFDAIEKAVKDAGKKGHTLTPSENPEIVAKALRSAAPGMVEEWVRGEQRDLTGSRVGPGLDRIFREAGISDAETGLKFATYLAAKRSREVWAMGKNPGMTRADANARIRRVETDPALQLWRTAAQKVFDWNENLLNYLVQAGALPAAEKARIMRKSKHYVPLSRFFESVGGDAIGASLTGKPLKSLSGSGRQIRDVREAMIDNAVALVGYAHKRMVTDAILHLGELKGMGKWVEEVPQEVVKRLKPIEGFREQLEAAGADLSAVDPDLTLEWYEPKKFPGLKDPILPVRDPHTGKTTWYQVHPGLYDSLKGMDFARWNNPLAKHLLEGPARAFRAGATGYRAAFGLVTNPLRDFQTFMVQGTEQNPAKAAAAWLKHTGAAYKDFLGIGSANPFADVLKAGGAMIAQPLGIDARTTSRLAKSLGKGKVGRIVTSPAEALAFLRDAFQISEGAPRAAEAEKIGRDQGWDGKKPLDLDTMLLMLKGGREVTTDFMAGGRAAKFLNRMIPFFNQAFQSPRAFARAFQRNPVGTALKGTLALTVPTLYLWWKNKDEDWYRDMPARDKFLYFHVGAGEDRVRIPRGFETGYLFSVLPEAIADSWYQHDPEAVREAMAHVFENANPFPVQPTLDKGFKPRLKLNAGGLPVLAGEAAQQLANLDDYFDQPIVPRGEEDLPAGEQKGPYTSGVAKMIGKWTGWSPRRIDHALQGVFAGLGKDIPSAIDAGARVAGGGGLSRSGREFEKSDIPIAGTLFAQGGKEGVGSKAVNDLYAALATSRERAASKENPETADERAARLKLTDAAAALKLLRQAQRAAPKQADRQQIQREIRTVAERALAAEPTDHARMQMGAEQRFIGKIGSKLAAVQHATDGKEEFLSMTPARRAQMRDDAEREILELAQQYAELRGMKWTGNLGELFPKLAARLEVAKDPERRRPPRLPGPSLGVPPSKESFDVLNEEMPLRTGTR